jgi:hypothetical protein
VAHVPPAEIGQSAKYVPRSDLIRLAAGPDIRSEESAGCKWRTLCPSLEKNLAVMFSVSEPQAGKERWKNSEMGDGVYM